VLTELTQPEKLTSARLELAPPIIELRQYLLHRGRRDELIELIPAMSTNSGRFASRKAGCESGIRATETRTGTEARS
jgi:hypothetical protein